MTETSLYVENHNSQGQQEELSHLKHNICKEGSRRGLERTILPERCGAYMKPIVQKY